MTITEVTRGSYSNFKSLVLHKGQAYGSSFSSKGQELGTVNLDGSSAQLKFNIVSGSPDNADPFGLVDLGDTLYFVINVGSSTTWGYYLSGSFPSVTSFSFGGLIRETVGLDSSNVILVVDANNLGFEPYVWNKNSRSTYTLLTDIFPGSTSSDPQNLTPFGDYVYFTATDSTNGRELFRADASSASLVVDIKAGASSSNPARLAVVNGALYFSAESSSSSGVELHALDLSGGSPSVSMVVDATAGAGSTSFDAEAAGAGDVYAVAGSIGSDSGLHVFNVTSSAY